MVIEADGIPFVAEVRREHLVPGLRVEVQRVLGREGLVAYNVNFGPGC